MEITECRCKECETEIGQPDGLYALMTLLKACQVSKEEITFSVECPQCGQQNSFTIKYR